MSELDTRGSHFYLAMYWAQAISRQTDDPELQNIFTEIAREITTNQENIVQELIEVQGKPIDIGGYYLPDEELISKAMRPSDTLNSILDQI